MPDLPTIEEGGVKGFDGGSWNGVVMPAGVPLDLVEKIYAPLVAQLKTQAVKDQLLRNGGISGGGTPAQFSAYIKAEAAKWAKVAKFAKIQLD